MHAVGPRDRSLDEGFDVAFEDLPAGRLRELDADYFGRFDVLVDILVSHDLVPVLQPVFQGFGWKGLDVAGTVVPPDDYARYTRSMWERLLAEAGLRPTTIAAQGGFFTHLAGLLRFLVLRAPRPLRWAGYATFPLLDGMAGLDRLARVRESELAAFVGGYLIVATHP